MTKPAVYNYKAAEDRIAMQKNLILYMGETIAKISAERDKYKGIADRGIAEVIKLRNENDTLRAENNNYRIRCRIAEADK